MVNDGRIVASPRAKKLASQMGVDLATVRGSGPHGRIQAEDVQQASGQPISCLLYTSPSPRDRQKSRMPSSA